MPVCLPARWLLAAVLATGGLASAAAAKPPDLPIDPKVNCAVPPAGVKIDVDIRFHFPPPQPGQTSAQQPATPPALRVKIGRPERELLPMPEVVEEIDVLPGVEECEIPGDIPRLRLFDLLFIPEPIGVMPQVEEVREPGEAGWCLCEARPCPSCAACTKAADSAADGPPPKKKPAAEKLARAKEVFRKAEEARRGGDQRVARAYYESICCLCPGSRIAEKAARRLQDMATQRPPRFADGQGRASRCTDPATRACELVGCAYILLCERRYEEAQAHALEALSLAPGHPAAVVALWQASAALREAARPTEPGSCPCVPNAMRRPSLPPTDPTVVKDLEKLLFEKEKPPSLPPCPGRTEEAEPAKKPGSGAKAPLFFIAPKEIVLEIVEQVKNGTLPR